MSRLHALRLPDSRDEAVIALEDELAAAVEAREKEMAEAAAASELLLSLPRARHSVASKMSSVVSRRESRHGAGHLNKGAGGRSFGALNTLNTTRSSLA